MAVGLPLGEASALALAIGDPIGEPAGLALPLVLVEADVEAAVEAPLDEVVGVLSLPPPQAASKAAIAGALSPSMAARRRTARRLNLPLSAPRASS
jgi:hypothetical protein